MPYSIGEFGENGCNGYPVKKDETGETVPGGCHGTRTDAVDHLRALEASEMTNRQDDLASYDGLISITSEDLFLRAEDDGGEDGHFVNGYLVPWNKQVHVLRPIKGLESYKRGALTRSITEAKRPIPLLGLHNEAEPVGIMVNSHDDEDGQFARFRLFNSTADRTLELIREGIWSRFSIGAFGVPARTKVIRTSGQTYIERSEVRLDHVALLRRAAYEDARVLAYRNEDNSADGNNEGEDQTSPARARTSARVRFRVRTYRNVLPSSESGS